jgi:hypothetical protein
MNKFIFNNLWWITFLIALALLIIHSFGIKPIKVDNTSIILLILLLISPFISTIKRIKFGDFEAEIDSQEVKKLKEDVEKKIAESLDTVVERANPITNEIKNKIYNLVENEPVLALAKLRIEIEKVISRLHNRVGPKQVSLYPSNRFVPLGKMLNDLSKTEFFPKDISRNLNEIIQICNRAVHGEEIKQTDAQAVVETGVSLLDLIYSFSLEILGNTLESRNINKEKVEEYQRAKYRLTTIIPYAESPLENVRIFGQEGLDEFLQGYEEFAEFVVDLRIIENNLPNE